MNEARSGQDGRRTHELDRLARRVLGIGDGASACEMKRAWRRRCLETHPDQNPEDPSAEQRFRLVNCAYRLLTEGTPCPELMAHVADTKRSPRHSAYDLSNAWGFYLWWRETFF